MVGGGEEAWHCKWTEKAVNTARQIYIQTYTEQNKGMALTHTYTYS